MRFRMVDQITQLEEGSHIEAVKHLTSAERYLQDHFPHFPIMPGVLMLESMYQAAHWLVRKSENFAHSMVVLKEARNVKFSGFVRPGQDLVVTAKVKGRKGDLTTLIAHGTVDGKDVASARLIVETCQLAERYPQRAASQDYLNRKVRQQFERVVSGEPEDDSGARLSVRWMWLDRMTAFVRGERSAAIKNISLTEEPMSDYLPGFPIMPGSLIVEGLAWTGGILANDQRGFRERVVLAKVNKAKFHFPALPGDQLRYSATIERNEPEGAFIRGTSHVGDQLQAEVDLFLAHLGDSFQEVQGDLLDPVETLVMLRLFGVFDVGRTPDGDPIDAPEKLVEAERKAKAESV